MSRRVSADMQDMFEWRSSYSVQIGSIDAQHQGLFAIARELALAMSAGQGKPVMAKILDRLVQYTEVHFAHEERLMRLHDYPGAAAHRAEHEALKAKVKKFQEEFTTGRAVVTLQVLTFLRSWLENHIRVSDQAYSAHLRGRAVA